MLISCYELGHQPLAIAAPAGLLRRAGFRPVLLDLAVEPLREEPIRAAGLVAISTPMHTALRLAIPLAERIRRLNPNCHICFFGLYAVLNREHLLGRYADSVLGGETDGPLLNLALRLAGRGARGGARPETPALLEGISFPGDLRPPLLRRPEAVPPAREGLPPLQSYAKLEWGGQSLLVGYVESTHGCKHLCRHCPIPSVYGGRFFAVEAEAVLTDIGELVARGARHITFGDPDFLNGPRHAERITTELHRRFPEVTFDFTAKISHLIGNARLLPTLAANGCLFVVSAVESLAPQVLEALDKGHTAQDVRRALELTRAAGIALRPSLVPFTPWSTLDDYLELLRWVAEEKLAHHLEPVQFAIRLLVPPGSLLEDSPLFLPFRGPLHQEALSYRWQHPDPRMDALQNQVAQLVEEHTEAGTPPDETFGAICRAALAAAGAPPPDPAPFLAPAVHPPAPRLSEPWFC